MKYFLIYYLDYTENDKISIKEEYMTKEDATNNLESVAVGHVKEMQGKQQSEICRQFDKSPDDILKNTSLKEGMYIVKSGDAFLLYEKTSVVISGRIWSSQGLKINKLGMFNFTEYNFDESNFRLSGSIVMENNKTTQKQHQNINNGPDYVSELKKIIKQNKGQIKLKPVKSSKGVLDELLNKFNENGGKFNLKKVNDDEQNNDQQLYQTLKSDTGSESSLSSTDSDSASSFTDTESSILSTDSSLSDSESNFDTDEEIEQVLKKMNNDFKKIDYACNTIRFNLPPPPPPPPPRDLLRFRNEDTLPITLPSPPPPPPVFTGNLPIFVRSHSDPSISIPQLSQFKDNNYNDLLFYKYNLDTSDSIDNVKIDQL